MTNYTFLTKLFLAFFAILTCNRLSAQTPDSALSTLETKYPQEKIYIQYDKAYYNPGETVWFKAYIQTDNLPTAISKTVFADLIDEKGNIINRKMMPVIQSGASSYFELGDTIKANKLYVRAYTTWMMNFDSTLIYTKLLNVLPAKNAAKKTTPPPTYNLQFFPEGGDMVENILSKIAFKANDNTGIPFIVKGSIVDGKGKQVTAFASTHDGMGVVSLLPAAGQTYKAQWKDKKGVQHETALPAAKKEGATFGIAIEGSTIHYTIQRPDTASAAFLAFHVVAQMQQRLMYSARINMSKKAVVSAPIVTDSMPSGVMQITLFNADEVPVAERLVFVNQDNYYFITDLHGVETALTKKAKNSVQIDVGGDYLSNLSVSITDASVNPISDNEQSIYSELLLSSDLKGYVFNPAYYFSSTEDSVKKHLDLVMMTNGWRRFKWEDVMANKFPEIKFLPENFLTVNGQVLGLTKTMLYNKQVTGIFKTKTSNNTFFTMEVDPAGNFKQPDLFFFDTAKMYYQLSNDKDKTLTTAATFSFKNSFIKAPLAGAGLLSNIFSPLQEDTSALNKGSNLASLQKAQNEFNRVRTLETVVVKTRQKSLKEKMDEEYTSGFFSGGDGYTFTTEDDPFAKTSPSVLAYLQGKVAGLQISTSGQGSATWRGSATSFFLNETNTDISALQSINMADVAMIKVFRPPFFGAMGGGAGGAIAIYTKKGASDNSQVKGLPYVNINGYTPIKEFYSPNYETAPTEDKDYRTTLYWNPSLYFDAKTRRIVLPFFNSDNCKKMRVVVEGINEVGQLTREEKIIQ